MFRPIAIATPRAYLRLCSNKLCSETAPPEKMTHVDSEGKAKMVDVGSKRVTARTAVACARIHVGRSAFEAIKSASVKKGDVLAVSELAGVIAAKKTGHVIPLCHVIPLDAVNVHTELVEEGHYVDIRCVAKCTGKTGVEMEALHGASTAALTIYDMCKAINKEMEITNIRLISKEGGKSGEFLHSKEKGTSHGYKN